MSGWMIYGATGYTGQLVAETAVTHGHKPLLAGRSETKLRLLAERLGLDYAVVSLDDTERLHQVVASVDAVYHAAGPFVHTSAPMRRACLAGGTHYLDITGEIPVYQQAFADDAAARETGIAILPGMGFDVIPSDCLLKYVADQLPDAIELEVVVAALDAASTSGISAGTAKSELEILAQTGNVIRRDGQLVEIPLGWGGRWFSLPAGRQFILPLPWGDVEMGYHTTGIPNITAYLAFPAMAARVLRVTSPILRVAVKSAAVRRFLGRLIDGNLPGPSSIQREVRRSWLWAQVRNASGETRQAQLETIEAYRFTAEASWRVLERVLDGGLRGTLTPAQALGADFVLTLPETRRHDGH